MPIVGSPPVRDSSLPVLLRRIAAAYIMSIMALPGGVDAQTIVPEHRAATVPPESERDTLTYRLESLGRHGRSHFRRVRHPEAEYEAGETLTFDRYHTVDVMYAWLNRWAERYPEIVELYQVGTSLEGRPIMQVTLTNKATGPATEKPAAFFEGGRHSGEITSSESVLWLIQHVVEGYGNDPEITRLLDRAAIYAKPQNNPDGSNLYLHTAQANRSSVRPVDNDGDGLFDEDPGNDLDGDGILLEMRWRDSEGEWLQDERDPTGRLMRRAEDGEQGEWSMADEGIDDDGDGRTDEDGVGGLDLHRNYAENWRPMPGREHTGRGWTQGGAGAYPLSEPETFAVVLFALENPNIGVANSMDTRVPMHLRPPSTSRSEERMYPEDLALYEHFDSVGLTITDYPWAGDVYHTYSTRNNPEGQGNPLFGHGPDFGYFYYGSIWYGDELWDGGNVGDVNGDGEEDDLDRLVWADSVAAGRGYPGPFKEWTAFQHPEHGEVEIGGWHPKFFSQNGPPEVLERWAGNQARFNLYMAGSLPELSADAAHVSRSGSGEGYTEWELSVNVRNMGRLPTALRQAHLVKIVRPDRVVLSFDGELEVGDEDDEDADIRFLDEDGEIIEDDGEEAELGYLQPGQEQTARFRFRTYGVDSFSGTFELLSTRGGVVRGTFSSGG